MARGGCLVKGGLSWLPEGRYVGSQKPKVTNDSILLAHLNLL